MEYGFGYSYPRRARPRSLPADEMVVIAGQSNAITSGISGATGLPAGWADTERVQMWNNGAGVFATYSPGAAAAWGPEAAYARAWLDDAANDGRTLYLVKYASGGSQLADTAIYGQSGGSTSDWSQTSGELYPAATAVVNAAKAALAIPRVAAVLWLQGEADSQGPATVAVYAANAEELYAAIRADWGDDETEIVANTISDLLVGSGFDFEGLLEQQLAVAAASPRNHLVETRGLTFQVGDVHFDKASINAIGAMGYALAHGGGTEAGWYDPRALIDIDYENDRVRIDGSEYSSVAAARTAGAIATDAAGDYVPMAGFVPAELTMYFHGVTAAVDPNTAQYAMTVEDGDADPNDDMIWISRQNNFGDGNVFTFAGFAGGVVQAGGAAMRIAGSPQAANGAECRLAGRLKPNDMKLCAGGTLGPADTSVVLPTINRLVVMNQTYGPGASPWGGSAKRVQLLDTGLSDARLQAKTATLV